MCVVTPSIKGFLIRILKMFLFPFLIEPFQKYHLKTNICHLSYRCLISTKNLKMDGALHPLTADPKNTVFELPFNVIWNT